MYTWKGLHHVGYIRYIVTVLTVKSITSTGKKVTTNGTIKICDDRKKPYMNSLWRADGVTQLGGGVIWTVYCMDQMPDCRELSGEAAFTVASDVNDDIRAFIMDHMLQAQKQHNMSK